MTGAGPRLSEASIETAGGGRITLIDFPAGSARASWLRDAPLEIATYRDATAIAVEHYPPRGARPTLAALYDSAGRRVADADRQLSGGSLWTDAPPLLAEERRADRAAMEEPPRDDDGAIHAFGGIAHRQFGHFLLESLSRFWWLDGVDDVRRVRPVLFGEPGYDRSRYVAAPYVRSVYAGLGIDPDRVVVVDHRHMRLPEVRVATPTMAIGGPAHPVFCAGFDRVVAGLGLAGVEPTRRIYLSRTALAKGHRRIFNESAIEAAFRRRGFEIVHPETLPFEEQVRVVRGARTLVGCDGSAMHLVAFATPATRILSIDSRVLANQFCVEEARGVTASHLYVGKPDGTRRIPGDPPIRVAPRRVLDALAALEA